MNNRLKRYAIFVGIFVMAAIIMAVGAALFLQSEFARIEKQQVSQDVSRIVNAVNHRIETLDTQAADWAQWDDSYEYVIDHNQEYVDSNLTDAALSNFGVNFMLYYDSKGKFVVAKGTDLTNGEDLEVPEELITTFTDNKDLLATSDTTSHSGFMAVQQKPLVFVSRPILDSQLKGPYHGTLVFAQYVQPETIQKLANLEDLSLSYQLIGSADITPDTLFMLSRLSSNSPSIKTLSSNRVAGYQVVNGIDRKPLFVARVEQRRDVYLESQIALLYYLIASIGVVFLATIMAVFTTRQAIAKDETIRVKDEFFSMASHELRTPLTAIRGNSQLLKQIYGPNNDKDFMRITDDIHSSSERLIRLVTNFLDLARLEQNRIPLTITEFRLSEALNPIIDELQTIANDKSIKLSLKVPGDLPLIKADQDRIKQVVYNLTGNSLKFTDTGSVAVSAETQGNFVKVSVADTGRGIPIASQKLLFRKFQQTKDSDAQKGSGLGLYISRVMVEKMGGTIQLESSEEGKGTTISFTIPSAAKHPSKS